MVIHSCANALFVNYCVVGILKIYFRHSDFKSCYTIIIYCSRIRPRCLLRAIHIYDINHVRFVFTPSCVQEDSCFIYVTCVCLRRVVSNTYCVVFLLYLSSSCVSGLSILIAPSEFSNVYLRNRNYLPFAITWVYPLFFFWRGHVALVLVFRIVFFVVVVLYVFILCLVLNVACVFGLIVHI